MRKVNGGVPYQARRDRIRRRYKRNLRLQNKNTDDRLSYPHERTC